MIKEKTAEELKRDLIRWQWAYLKIDEVVTDIRDRLGLTTEPSSIIKIHVSEVGSGY